MSAESPKAGKDLVLRELGAEARYARERYELYKARSYSSRLTSNERLRELERRSKLAQRLVDRAKLVDRTRTREKPPASQGHRYSD